MVLEILRYVVGAVVVAALTIIVLIVVAGFRAVHDYRTMATRFDLAEQRARRLAGLLAVSEVERETERALYDVALRNDQRRRG